MSFTNQLLQKHASTLKASVTHKLTNELCDGTLSDSRLFTYLAQDLKFFNAGLQLFGKALAGCDEPKASITLGKQIGFVCNDENDYFQRVLDELRPTVANRSVELVVLPAVSKYIDYMSSLHSYTEVITALYVMEKVYLDWAENTPAAPGLAYKFNEWIVLHSGDDFNAWTKFLQSEVDRVTNQDTEKEIEEVFVKILLLEEEFFDECYGYSG